MSGDVNAIIADGFTKYFKNCRRNCNFITSELKALTGI